MAEFEKVCSLCGAQTPGGTREICYRCDRTVEVVEIPAATGRGIVGKPLPPDVIAEMLKGGRL